MEQQVAWRGNRVARSGANLPERMQIRRPRRPKELIPGAGPKPQDAGKSAFKVARSHRAYQRGQVCAQRPNGGAMVRARVQGGDQEDGGAGQRCGYRLGYAAGRVGRADGIGWHRRWYPLGPTKFRAKNVCVELASKHSDKKSIIAPRPNVYAASAHMPGRYAGRPCGVRPNSVRPGPRAAELDFLRLRRASRCTAAPGVRRNSGVLRPVERPQRSVRSKLPGFRVWGKSTAAPRRGVSVPKTNFLIGVAPSKLAESSLSQAGADNSQLAFLGDQGTKLIRDGHFPSRSRCRQEPRNLTYTSG